MIRARLTLTLLGLVIAFAPACEKKGKGDKKDDTTVPDGGGDVPKVAIDKSVPQEPDPPAIAQGAQSYLQGQYDEAVATLQPLYADLKSRNQYRASGLAGAWLALAHAKKVFEDGKEPADWAAAMAEATGDKEVQAAADLARGAVMLGAEDFAAAETRFTEAARTNDRTVVALANILRGEAMILAAFGSGESDTMEDPAKLANAKQAYDVAAKAAAGQPAEKLLMGRVEEGYAALGDYQNDRTAVCTHAVAAIDLFQKAGATRLLEGPAKLATDNKCEVPAGVAPAEGEGG
jgi:tetratricopeptide (TPR) repeat protein